MKISIIIPTFNTENYIQRCINSVFKNAQQNLDLEVIVVDGYSTDSTFHKLSRLQENYSNLIILRTEINSGPGVTRNIGVKNATGDWIMFLDSDDYIDEDALSKLQAFLVANDEASLDAVGFNWAYNPNSISAPKTHFAGRTDGHYLELDKEQWIKNYLRLRMDNSVIYTAIRRSLIIDNSIWFSQGYHEDVDYIFFVYWHSRKSRYLNQVLYYKTSRPDSIVNTISSNHIKGFMQAFKRIGIFIQKEKKHASRDFFKDYKVGLIGLIATRAREIWRNCPDVEYQVKLYRELYENWINFDFLSTDESLPFDDTLYSVICKKFLNVMCDKSVSVTEKSSIISKYIGETANKRWSCDDLHSSVFLRPDQIRTCCKRFFVDGEMRGDVVLIDLNNFDPSELSANKILEAKRSLYARINRGEDSECTGCPFLEFKEWGSLDNFQIGKLSFEHHSICNLRCSYCSETYYGGLKPKYDVNALVDDFLHNNMIDSDATVIWGGGEPIAEKRFSSLINKIIDNLPLTTHRVLTNSVIYSETIYRLLSENRISIFTSVDAGTPETFVAVRGRDKLNQVMKHLKKYASVNPRNVTVKYIFTSGNQSLEEINAFTSLVERYDLSRCNFQISTDFKDEQVSVDVLAVMTAMYKLLIGINCRVVFFDELIRQRLNKFNSDTEESLRIKLSELGVLDIIANKDLYKSVAIWGTGEQAKLLCENSTFFKCVDVEFFVDSTPMKKNTKFLDRQVLSPDVLLESDIPIVIAAVQNYPKIYDLFLDMGIKESRLIRNIIL